MGIIMQTLGLDPAPTAPVYPTIDTELARAVAARNGSGLSFNTVVGLPGAYRAMSLIYGMGSSLPINSWRGEALAPRQPQVITKPDPWRPRRSWTLRTLTNLTADGSAFLKKALDPVRDDGTIIAAETLNPFNVTIRRDKNDRKFFEHRTRTGTENLSAEQVEQVWLNEFPNAERGIGPIEACRRSLQSGVDIRDYAGQFFGAVPPGVLTSDQPIDAEYAKAAKKWWHDGEAGQVKVMGKGLKFETTLIKPEDAQWIEAQNFTVLDIARMFGIPPVLLLVAIESSSLTYQNLQMVNEQLLDTTLKPLYLEPVEAALTELIPAGQEARFDVSKYLRRDDKTRMETHKLAIDAGVYDADYARLQERIPGPAPRKESVPK